MVLPQWVISEILKREGSEPILTLLTVTGAELSGTIRWVNDQQDIVSRGETYTAMPFLAGVMQDNDEEPRADIVMPNIDREIGRVLMEITTGLLAKIELIVADNPDVPFYVAPALQLQTAEINDATVTGTFVGIDLENEPFVSLRVTQNDFPGLWRDS